MFDKVTFEKICNVTCTLDELKCFCSGIAKKEFDVENCFEKYYSLDAILKCIQLYKSKHVSAEYLAYWANAYDWIIMGGFQLQANDEEKRTISLAKIITWNVCDWLDSLSFFDGDEDFLSIEYYAKNFRVLDSVYKNDEKWKVFYTFDTDICDCEEYENDINILLVNDAKNVYYKLYSDCCDFKEVALEEKFQETTDMGTIENELKAKGYKEICPL